MEQRLIRQISRLNDLHSLLYEGKDIREFISQRRERSPSSLEEELVSNLPLFDDVEEQEISQEASKILNGKTQITDSKDFEFIMNKNPELGKKLKAIGMKNHQHVLQAQFYDKSKEIFSLSKNYEFPVKYELLTPVNFMRANAVCLEQFNYAGSIGYRSLFYHLMRHLNNLTGDESCSEIKDLARETFSGKKVLELGSGPGFFLYTLRELGADVIGIDTNDKFREQTEKSKLNIFYGNAKDLSKLVEDKKFDVVISKDFLSYGVTRDDAEPIMKSAYAILKDGGLSIHQIEYRKTSEEEYLKHVEQFCKTQGSDFERMRNIFSGLNDEQKEYFIRKNILNISLEHLKELGYNPFTSYRLDVDEFLTITLGK